jgi:D-3-phosphoglycerate dehydrogenase
MTDRDVLVSPSSFGTCGEEPLELLEKYASNVILNPHGRKLTAEEVLDLASGCVGIVAGVEPLHAEILAQLPALRCISRVGVGLQNIDLEAARGRGIAIRNTPDGPTLPVAELAVGLAFAVLRRIPLADRNLRAGEWKKEMGSLLTGKKVGIVGIGRIGRAAAELFLGLGCKVVATDPAPDRAWLESRRIELMSLADLLRQADVVALHLSIDPEAPPVIGARELDLMKPGAVLLNLARGDAVEEESLYQALQSGRIAGAGLDVFRSEPYQGPLTGLDQVVLTPHLGTYAREARLQMELDAVENLIDALGWREGERVST